MFQSTLLRNIQHQAQKNIFLLNFIEILQMAVVRAGLSCIGYHWIYVYGDIKKEKERENLLLLLVLLFCPFSCHRKLDQY